MTSSYSSAKAAMTEPLCTILGPNECSAIAPDAKIPMWVYRYQEPRHGWVLSVATHGEPGSAKLSLGGFRIAPENRASVPGYNNDREAIGLGLGMEEKVFWSRLIQVGGPLGLKNLHRLCGGKCVLLPSAGSRVGEPLDYELLEFGTTCLKDMEKRSGVFLTTGQDLGHGKMHDGKQESLNVLHSGFYGSIVSDTSRPTGEGNLMVVLGALTALGIPLTKARVGLFGAGHIGMHILAGLRARGISVTALDTSPTQCEAATKLGAKVWPATDKAGFMAQPLDILVFNANGSSLDDATVTQILANTQVQFLCGSENLVMPNHANAERLRAGGKIFCPTELGGMMGYLTAVEEYMTERAGQVFDVAVMMKAAARLREATEEVVEYIKANQLQPSFEGACKELFHGA